MVSYIIICYDQIKALKIINKNKEKQAKNCIHHENAQFLEKQMINVQEDPRINISIVSGH